MIDNELLGADAILGAFTRRLITAALILGHNNIWVTLEHYCHPAPDGLDASIKDVFFSVVGHGHVDDLRTNHPELVSAWIDIWLAEREVLDGR